ncbi:sensor histidine kinase [Brachybacterium sp.]|uniref:sensor histidine kinase n=1 Tax=Brachybacterium sp. TaxID=1891286 RepID=UPI002ED09795
MTTTPAPRAIAIALGCWVVVIALLLLLPLLAAAEGTGELVPARAGSAAWWATALVLTAQSVALLRAHPAPRVTLLVIAALALLLGAIGPGAAYTLSHLPVLLAVLLAAPRRPWSSTWPALAGSALAVATGVVLNGLRSGAGTMPGVLGEGVLQGVGVVGFTALIALSLASLRIAREAQRRALEALTREREALHRAAASEERAAMARELHDIAAHHLSGIALVAAAADRQIDTDPQAAHDSVRQVRTQTRSVLDDIRRVVGLLRGTGPAERGVETLETLPELLRTRAEAGVDVRLEQSAPPPGRAPGAGLGPLAQLVAYRMVQESLSNVAVHAPGASCLVTIDDSHPARWTLTVVDDGPGTMPVTSSSEPGTGPGERSGDPTAVGSGDRSGAGGFGLVGMRERAELMGGQLEHGPTAGGGWRVHLRLPRDLTGAPTTSAPPGKAP